MRTVPGGRSRNASTIVTILTLNLTIEDRFYLREILTRNKSVLGPNCRWRLQQSASVESVLRSVRCMPGIAVVICDDDPGSGEWRRLLVLTSALSRPPLLIVASRLADEHLWAEALNLGAHDVLAKPFECAEALRVVGYAVLRWQREQATLAPARSTAAVA
jgi:DNA-binding response OmpR family regulator